MTGLTRFISSRLVNRSASYYDWSYFRRRRRSPPSFISSRPLRSVDFRPHRSLKTRNILSALDVNTFIHQNGRYRQRQYLQHEYCTHFKALYKFPVYGTLLLLLQTKWRVCLRLSDGYTNVPGENGWTDYDAVRDVDSGPKEARTRWNARCRHLADTIDRSLRRRRYDFMPN